MPAASRIRSPEKRKRWRRTDSRSRSPNQICANGAAAHHIHPGDIVIIMAYHLVDDAEARSVRPRVVFVDQHNKITGKTDHEAPGTVG